MSTHPVAGGGPLPGILVVDDEAAVRSLLEALFRLNGFRVWSAGTGEKALDLFRAHAADVGLVLLDVRMPGLDGPQTLQQLRAIDPGVTCCFLSGHFGDYSEQELRDYGAAEVFTKPFSPTEVVRRCRELTRTERRSSPRLSDRRMRLVVAAEPDRPDWECWLKDRSHGGVALWGPRSLPAGERLRVRPAGAAEARPWARVEVRHCVPQGDGWVLGCRFLGGEADAGSLFSSAG